LENIYNFLMELDKLKSVYRRSYIHDTSRNENSAEHSWHLALALLTLQQELDIEIDMHRAIKMALVHDICEIGAGDISIYDPDRSKKEFEETKYIEELSQAPINFVTDIKLLWEEYEAQSSPESRWVKIIDRLLPFIMNMHTNGKTWLEQGVSKSQVIAVNQLAAVEAPEVYEWILEQIEIAVNKGWLIDS